MYVFVCVFVCVRECVCANHTRLFIYLISGLIFMTLFISNSTNNYRATFHLTTPYVQTYVLVCVQNKQNKKWRSLRSRAEQPSGGKGENEKKKSRHPSSSRRATSTSSPPWRCTGEGFWCEESVGDEETMREHLAVYDLCLTALIYTLARSLSFSYKHTHTIYILFSVRPQFTEGRWVRGPSGRSCIKSAIVLSLKNVHKHTHTRLRFFYRPNLDCTGSLYIRAVDVTCCVISTRRSKFLIKRDD